MRLQDYIIDTTRMAQEEAFRYAKSVPEDKLDWKPEGAGRSVMDMVKELAQCPDWAFGLVQTGQMDWSDEAQAASAAETEGWKTVADCEAACLEKLDKLYGLYRDLPDAKFDESMNLPFGPGGSMKEFSMAEIMEYPRWNFNYHLGQIGYIQTLYGDRDMH